MPSNPHHAFRTVCGHPGNGWLMLTVMRLVLNARGVPLLPNEANPS